jgi:hypothetical protein
VDSYKLFSIFCRRMNVSLYHGCDVLFIGVSKGDHGGSSWRVIWSSGVSSWDHGEESGLCALIFSVPSHLKHDQVYGPICELGWMTFRYFCSLQFINSSILIIKQQQNKKINPKKIPTLFKCHSSLSIIILLYHYYLLFCISFLCRDMP